MSNYIKRKVYKKLLNEMAIITQTSFLDRVIKLAKQKPSIAGAGILNYSDLLKRIENSRLEDKENSLFAEIVKCINSTNLFELSGKENKKARKKAEILIIKQLRRYKNIDGENIEFKGVLPMFDNILDFLENKSDISFDDCIFAADLYMRKFFNIANEEDKKTISKGSFDFSIIFEKTNFYRNYLSKINDSINSTKLYEDESLKVVYPESPRAFNAFISSINVSPPWCTRRANTWYSYSNDHYLCIAVQKNLRTDDSEYCFSLKVNFDGSIDAKETCDRYNDHCTKDQINKVFKKVAVDAIAELPNIEKPSREIDFDNTIKALADLNSEEEIKEVFAQICNVLPEQDAYSKYEYLIQNTELDKLKVADIIVDSLSFYFFDNPQVDSYIIGDVVIVQDFPVDEIFANFKEKILNKNAHPRYLYAFLTLYKESLENLIGYDNAKAAILIALDTTNSNNFSRIIQALLSAPGADSLLKPRSLKHKLKKSGLTKNNLDLYEAIYNSEGFQTLLKEQKTEILNSAGTDSFYEAKYFIAQLALRFTDSLTEKLSNENINIKDIDNHLVMSYLKQDFTSVFAFKRYSKKGPEDRQFLEISYEQYANIRDNLLFDKQIFEKVLSISDQALRNNLAQFIQTSLTTEANPLELKNDQVILFCLNKLFSYQDFSSEFLSSVLFNRFAFNVEDFSLDTQKNISNIIFDKNNRQEYRSICLLFNAMIKANMIKANSDNKAIKDFLILLKNQESALKAEILHDIWKDLASDFEINFSQTKYQKLPAIFDDIFKISFSDQESKYFISNALNKYELKDNPIYDLMLCNVLSKTKKADFNTKIACFMSLLQHKNEDEVLSQNLINLLVSYDSEIMCSDEVINFIKENCTYNNFTSDKNIAADYLSDSLKTEIVNKIIYSCTSQNIMFPKEAMQIMLLDSSYSGIVNLSRTIFEAIFKNFILINNDGINFLQGTELTLVRNTLKEIFSDGGNYFNNNETKKIVPKLIMKLNPVARKHMAIVFPKMKDEFFDATAEERDELQIDSLVRQYIKMLLS